MRLAFVVVMMIVLAFAIWLMWKTMRGAVDAGRSQNRYFQRLRKPRDAHGTSD